VVKLGFVPELPLATDRLDLRLHTAADLDAMADLWGRSEVVEFLYQDVQDRSGAERMLQNRLHFEGLLADGDRLVLAAEVRETAEVVGEVVLACVSVAHRQGEIGFVFHPDHQSRGYAAEASTVLLRVAFEHVGFHRVVGRADGRNLPSAALMGRLGMRREAHFVENEYVKGEWTDEVVYALLATEWSAR
jgi:RimJ/RimL family protein N-acetyltransferase